MWGSPIELISANWPKVPKLCIASINKSTQNHKLTNYSITTPGKGACKSKLIKKYENKTEVKLHIQIKFVYCVHFIHYIDWTQSTISTYLGAPREPRWIRRISSLNLLFQLWTSLILTGRQNFYYRLPQEIVMFQRCITRHNDKSNRQFVNLPTFG